MNSNALNSLLQFDLKFDSLKAFLDNILQVVNEHGNVIISMQGDLETRVIDRQVREPFIYEIVLYSLKQLKDVITRITDSALIHDPDFMKLIASSKDHKQEFKQGNMVEEATSKFCLNLSSYGKAIAMLYNKNKDLEENFQRLQKEVSQKVNKEDAKIKAKKRKKKIGMRVIFHKK